MGGAIACAVAIASTLAAAPASADEALIEPLDEVPYAAPWSLEWLNLSVAYPFTTIGLRLGAHGWLADRFRWEVHGEGQQTLGRADLSGDGQPDFDASEPGPYFTASASLAIPLRRSVGNGWYYTRLSGNRDASGKRIPLIEGTFIRVDDLSLVAGVRAGVYPDAAVAIPLGLRWARRDYTEVAYRLRERWIEARVLLFPYPLTVGADLEVAWLPLTWGGSLFAQFVAEPFEYGHTVRCVNTGFPTERCEVDGPLSAFTPLPGQPTVIVGLRLRTNHPF